MILHKLNGIPYTINRHPKESFKGFRLDCEFTELTLDELTYLQKEITNLMKNNKIDL